MPKRPRNLIFISVDDLRSDALSAFPDRSRLRPHGLEGFPRTPALDQFAHEGFYFLNCHSTAPATPPSHASMLTGHFPYRHGLRLFASQELKPSSKTLFEFFSRAGFSCFMHADASRVFHAWRLDRGAELLPDECDEHTLDKFEASVQAGKPTVLFYHFFDAHFPYGRCYQPLRPTDNQPFIDDTVALGKSLGKKFTPQQVAALARDWDQLHDLNVQIKIQLSERGAAPGVYFPRYLDGVNRFDSLRFSRVMKEMERRGLLDDALLVITSDHGEAVIEPRNAPREAQEKMRGYSHFQHLMSVSEELLRVPLIFWSSLPNFKKGRASGLVSSVDILPTLLKIFGIDFDPGRFDGVDRSVLFHTERNRADALKEALQPSSCYAEAWYENLAAVKKFWANRKGEEIRDSERGSWRTFRHPFRLHQRTLRTGSYKLVRTEGGGDSLYHVENDPGERFDLVPGLPYAQEASRAYTQLSRRLSATRKMRSVSGPRTPPASPDLVRQLKNLGYLG